MDQVYAAEEKDAFQQLSSLKETIYQAEDILSILSLLRIYRRKSDRMKTLHRAHHAFAHLTEQLKEGMQNLANHRSNSEEQKKGG